ncbi:MAG: hypothetical protein V2G50_05810 [bacterium JZ-2024 1]
MCPHCRAELFPVLQGLALFKEALEKAASALQQRDMRSAHSWLKACELWRPPDDRGRRLDALWAEFYAQTGDVDRAAEVAVRASLENRSHYEALRDATTVAREWASWSLHMLECGLYRTAEWALRRSMRSGSYVHPLQALLQFVLDIKQGRPHVRPRASAILESALPDDFLRWLYREIQPRYDALSAPDQFSESKSSARA